MVLEIKELNQQQTLFLYIHVGSTDYQTLLTESIDYDIQKYLFIGFFIAQAIKTPAFPFHGWQPLAHGESNTGTSVILAAILLKLATYGILRYLLPLFPEASLNLNHFVHTQAIISIVYSCLTALSLIDIKSVVAYSSIAHMNVGMIGLFSNDLNGIVGAFICSISHGFISGGLFIMVGMLYNRYHSKNLNYYRGLALFMPVYCLLFFLYTLANQGFPLISMSFIGENLLFFSTMQISPIVTLFVTTVSVLLPIYFITMFNKISYGTISPYFVELQQDVNIKEFNLQLPLQFLNFFFGIFVNIIIESITMPVLHLLY